MKITFTHVKLAALAGFVWWQWDAIGSWVHAALDRLPRGGPTTEQRVPQTQRRRGDGHPAEQPQSDGGEIDCRTVIGNIDHEWQLILRESGHTYRKPVLVLYNGQTWAGCSGRADARIGPFYCPDDQKIYVPASLSQEIEQRSGCQGAPCRFVQALVAAHEFGHHIQNLLGLMRGGRGGPGIELQADCLSGLWARHEDDRLKKEGRPGLVEPGDIEAALRWQGAIGNDVMMREAGRPVDPSRFTHGSSVQRQQAFRVGWERGTLAACNIRDSAQRIAGG